MSNYHYNYHGAPYPNGTRYGTPFSSPHNNNNNTNNMSSTNLFGQLGSTAPPISNQVEVFDMFKGSDLLEIVNNQQKKNNFLDNITDMEPDSEEPPNSSNILSRIQMVIQSVNSHDDRTKLFLQGLIDTRSTKQLEELHNESNMVALQAIFNYIQACRGGHPPVGGIDSIFLVHSLRIQGILIWRNLPLRSHWALFV